MSAGTPSSSGGSSSAAESENEGASDRRDQSLAIRDRSSAKRKRADTATGSSTRRRRSPPDDDDDDDDDNDDDENDPEMYDPDQPMEERRRIQRGFRDLQKSLNENMEEYMQPNSKGLLETLRRAQELSSSVKQTNEATIDARLLVNTIDLSYRKTVRMVQGSTSQGVDIDEFVSKCITYMRQGGGIADDDAPDLSSTQRQRRRRGREGDDEENDEMLNWPHLGRFACLPSNHRPALSGFLVGPLSVEKKVRKITKRTARFNKDALAETRPEVLNVDELSKKENDLTSICAKILKQLRDVQIDAQQRLQEIFEERPNMEQREMMQVMHEHGLRDTGGVDLLRFVVNPKSFGQTVENMFYVSFLIRDGKVNVEFDEQELPSLSPVDPGEATGGAKTGAMKHQAIFSMDMKTWRDIIEAFNITTSMIEHRKETVPQGPGAIGWYS
ncbi:hypothetical protein ACHAQA_002175 [Verticillium albo-atrum]